MNYYYLLWNTGVFEYNLPIDIATATTTTTITSILYSYILYISYILVYIRHLCKTTFCICKQNVVIAGRVVLYRDPLNDMMHARRRANPRRQRIQLMVLL